MLQTPTNLEQEALKLPREDRARMACYLLDSLEVESPYLSREAIEKAWVEESLQRYEAYQRGEMESYSLEEFAAQLKKLDKTAAYYAG